VYQILEPVSKGGMGEVYRARDTKLGREVAIKVLPADFARDAEHVARFKREAQVLASLSHSNIGVIHDLQKHDDTRFRFWRLSKVKRSRNALQRGPSQRTTLWRSGNRSRMQRRMTKAWFIAT